MLIVTIVQNSNS